MSVKRNAIVGLVLALAGCQSGPGVVADRHTGQKVVTGQNVNAHSGAFEFMRAQPFHSSSRGYGFTTLYSGYGWKHLSEAWSFGRRLPYAQTGLGVPSCYGACTTMESGRVALSESEFRLAAMRGLEFELVGTAGKVQGRIPASAFKAVLDLE